MQPGSHAAVVIYASDPSAQEDTHIRVARTEFAKKLAHFKGCAFGGDYDPSARYRDRLYFIPTDTLFGPTATALGIYSDQDLFGGVVPHGFVGTKVITHPLIEPNASAPLGWSYEFGNRVGKVVLSGFSAFTHADARRAGARILEHGPARIKPACATAGRDQTVVCGSAELEIVLAAMDPLYLEICGLVIEENLTEVETYSVGQARVAGTVATYYGVQRFTTDNGGEAVYGGSDLIVARGDFDALLALGLPEEAQLAISQARVYDAAAFELFQGLFVSRRNYDIITGLDVRGRRRCAVLEQSWRMGGASAAEMAALDAFRAETTLNAVKASSFEAYGESKPPPDATIYFRGLDERIGPILRYATVRPYVDAR